MNPPTPTTFKRGEVRVYPSCCMSAQCGRASCHAPAPCPNLPTKQAFDDWRASTGAIAEDSTWCPSVYIAQHDSTLTERRFS